jgi:hypothetical protein
MWQDISGETTVQETNTDVGLAHPVLPAFTYNKTFSKTPYFISTY